MEVKLASSYGFCFGVKRAIEIAEDHRDSATMGPLIHNQNEIDRLRNNFNVNLYHNLDEVKKNDTVIIRTHGIPKNELKELRSKDVKVINATCPFVTTPQRIVKKMTEEGYCIVIFGDREHPEVKGVMSYGRDDNITVVLGSDELENVIFKKEKIATVAQTTRKKEEYLQIVNYLILRYKEVRVFNTICDATFENQDAARTLSKEVDVMVVVGGKNSSNTKQLFTICEENTTSYLVEDEKDLKSEWFIGKKVCGITAGASTPDWIIQNIINKLKAI